MTINVLVLPIAIIIIKGRFVTKQLLYIDPSKFLFTSVVIHEDNSLFREA